jgi:small conductance mechanosensitive channel
MDVNKIFEQIRTVAIEYTPKIIGAIIIVLIGFWIIKILSNRFNQFLDKKNIDVSLRPFIKGLFNALLKVLLFISVLGTLGITMTSFVAIIGAAGLAIGMALSGTLQNFAGGVVILIFKPYRVGDVIDAQGYRGKVSEIQIFNTILKSPDNQTVIIPNGKLSNSSMINFSTEPLRRVDWTFGIAYGDDANKARELITQLCAEDERILNEPPVFIALSELAASSVNFTVRAWVNGADYWNVYFDLNEKVYNNFEAAGLNIPFQQVDVHMHNVSQNNSGS